ncbi:MAG: glycosyltransferase family 2 protein [Acidobacteriia bacterium]|nr:glycosyltransferase family 2 protein [Terriglobia bacterium]
MKPRISAVINTLNEEKNLPFALRSVQPWVDEIVVVDMYSTDRTVEIAREFGAQVYLHRGPGFNYPPRAFAVNQASSEWILVVDADELIPVALSRDLRRMADSGEADVALLPRINYLLGAVIRYTAWGARQDAQVRFFKKGFVVGSSVAHRDFKPVEGARIKVLSYRGDNAIVHFNYLDSQQFIERLNRYTSIEANQAFERGERRTPVRALLRGVKEFGDRYIRAGGFRDGWRGFYLSLFMSFYRIVTAAKLQELTALGRRELIESRYRQEAEEILKAYGESHSPAAS